MARNAEKAQSMLYRFREAQAAELGLKPVHEKRPYSASSVDNLQDAERWRGDVIREISRKVTRIMDANLSEFQVRDINDNINKLIGEKTHWEYRIKELGGPDYRRTGPKVTDDQGREVPGTKGYKYFGRARDLPGVKELLVVKPKPDTAKRTKHDMYKKIDAGYYGYNDEDDGVLLEYEKEQAEIELERIKDQMEADKRVRAANGEKEEEKGGNVFTETEFIKNLPIPTQKDVEAWLVEQRKRKIMDKYLGEKNGESK